MALYLVWLKLVKYPLFTASGQIPRSEIKEIYFDKNSGY
jgi:hypothetical protein